MRWIVDRVAESAHVRGLIEGAGAPRITFFEAGPFCGKSTLMQHLLAAARAQHGTCACVHIDFDDTAYANPVAIIDSFRAAVGDKFLPETKRAMSAPITLHASATSTDSSLESGATVQAIVHYPSDNPVVSAARAALIEDLRQLACRASIFIDTFEKSLGTAESTWVGNLLHAIEHNPRLILVVAGREVPLARTLRAGAYKRFRLTPVTDIPQWEAWLTAVGGEPLLAYFRAHLALCCAYRNPLEIIPLLVLDYMRRTDPDFSF